MTYWVLKAVLTPVLRFFYRVRVEGAEHLPHAGPVILASNHLSFCDSFFLPLVLRRRVTFVAKAEYFEDRKTAWFFRAVGQIPVKRGGGTGERPGPGVGQGSAREGRDLRDLPGGDPLARRTALQGPHRRGPSRPRYQGARRGRRHGRNPRDPAHRPGQAPHLHARDRALLPGHAVRALGPARAPAPAPDHRRDHVRAARAVGPGVRARLCQAQGRHRGRGRRTEPGRGCRTV